MKYLYETATVCIGQITNRPRLKNTVPHKAFEAAFFGKPYLSSDTLGIREFLPGNNQCYYLEELSAACLEEAILDITGNAELQSDLSLNIAKRYKEVASQATLSRKFFEIISS
jgi:glycosyltransferase involved in cell wall biosynthesis